MPTINRAYARPQSIAPISTPDNQLSTWEYIKQTVYTWMNTIKEFVIQLKNRLLGIQEAPPALDSSEEDDPVSKQEITVTDPPSPKILSEAQKQQLDNIKIQTGSIQQKLNSMMMDVLNYNANSSTSENSSPELDLSIILPILKQIPKLANAIPPGKNMIEWLTDNDNAELHQHKVAHIFPTDDPVINQYCVTIYHALEAQTCCYRLNIFRQESMALTHKTKSLPTEIKDLSKKLTDIFAQQQQPSDIAALIELHSNDIKQLTTMKAEVEQTQHKLMLLNDKILFHSASICILTRRPINVQLKLLLPTLENDMKEQLTQQAPSLMQRIKEKHRDWFDPNPQVARCAPQREKVSNLFFAMYRMRGLPKENLLDELQQQMHDLMDRALDDVRIEKLCTANSFYSREAKEFEWKHGLPEFHNIYARHTIILHKEIEQLMKSANIKDEMIKTVLEGLPSNTFSFARSDFKKFPETTYRGNLFPSLAGTEEEMHAEYEIKAITNCPALIDYTFKHFETSPLSAWQEKTFQAHLTNDLIGMLKRWHTQHIDDHGHLDSIGQQYLSEILYDLERTLLRPCILYTHKLLETKSLCTQLAKIQVHINTCEQNIKEIKAKISELHNNVRDDIKNNKPEQLVDNALQLHSLQKQSHSLYEAKAQYEVRKNVHMAALNHIKYTALRDSISREYNAVDDVLSDAHYKELAKNFTNEPISPNIIPINPQENAMQELYRICVNISDPNSLTIKEKQEFAAILGTLWKSLPMALQNIVIADDINTAAEFFHTKLAELYPPFVQQLNQCITDVVKNQQSDTPAGLPSAIQPPFWDNKLIRDILDTQCKANSSWPHHT